LLRLLFRCFRELLPKTSVYESTKQEVLFMKKMLIWFVIFMLASFCAPALAAEVTMPEGGIVKLDPAGTYLDLDDDGEAELISLSMEVTDEYESFTLKVNDSVLLQDGWGLTGDLFAVQMRHRICLAVPEYGMSDDHYSYMYVYENGVLTEVGGIPALANDMEKTMTGVAAMVRGSTLQTWFRPAEFVLATGGYFTPDSYDYISFPPVVVEVPRGYYPVGTVVRLKQDVTLQQSPVNPAAARTLKSGEMAVIAATDDQEWLYIVTLEDYEYGEFGAGWAHMTDLLYVDTDAGSMFSSEVFDGLLFAD